MGPENLNNKFCYGQKMIRKRAMSGKKDVAFIVSEDAGYEYLVKMAHSLPYNFGDEHFFEHIENLKRKWHHTGEGIQQNIFN